MIEVFMPKMSDNMEAGEIVEWLVKEGSQVEKGQAILSISTDKATVDLEAPASGFLKGIREGVIPGATIPVGQTLAFIAREDESIPILPPLGSTSAPPASPPAGLPLSQPVRASPAVRRLAKDLGVDLALVNGTGQEGRVTEQDVRSFLDKRQAAALDRAAVPIVSPVAQRMAQEIGIDLGQIKGTGLRGQVTKEDVQEAARLGLAAPVAPQPASDDAWLDPSPIQRLTGQRMLESVTTAPQFTLDVEVDMTRALEFRQAWQERVQHETGERLSITTVLVKVVAAALERFPRANVSFEGGRLRLHKQINIGVALGNESGLFVPVICDAGTKSLVQIARELAVFKEKARTMRFRPEDLTGGTFTVSNLGMFGIDRFQAIINPPQSAILAVGRIRNKPVEGPGDSMALRRIMSCTLSVDHRSMDGIQGAALLSLIKELLENPFLLVH